MNKSIRITIWSMGAIAFLYAIVFYILSVKLNEDRIQLGIQYNISQLFPELEYKAEKIETKVGFSHVTVSLKNASLSFKENQLAAADSVEVKIPVSSILFKRGTNSVEFSNIQLKTDEKSWQRILPVGKQEILISQLRMPSFLIESNTSVRFNDLFLIQSSDSSFFIEKFSLKNIKLKKPTAFELKIPMKFDRKVDLKLSLGARFIGELSLADLMNLSKIEIRGSAQLKSIKLGENERDLGSLRGKFNTTMASWRPISLSLDMEGDTIKSLKHTEDFENTVRKGRAILDVSGFLQALNAHTPGILKGNKLGLNYENSSDSKSIEFNLVDEVKGPFLGRATVGTMKGQLEGDKLSIELNHTFNQGLLKSYITAEPFSFSSVGKRLESAVRWKASFSEIDISNREILESMNWLGEYKTNLYDSLPDFDMAISCEKCTVEGETSHIFGSLKTTGDETELKLAFEKGSAEKLALAKNNGTSSVFSMAFEKWPMQSFKKFLPMDFRDFNSTGNGLISISNQSTMFDINFEDGYSGKQKVAEKLLSLLSFEQPSDFKLTSLKGKKDLDQVSIESMKLLSGGEEIDSKLSMKSLEIEISGTRIKQGSKKVFSFRGSNLNSLTSDQGI